MLVNIINPGAIKEITCRANPGKCHGLHNCIVEKVIGSN